MIFLPIGNNMTDELKEELQNESSGDLKQNEQEDINFEESKEPDDVETNELKEAKEQKEENAPKENKPKDLTKKTKIKFLVYFIIMLTTSIVYLLCKIFDPLKGLNQSELQSGNIVNFTKYIMILTFALTIISFIAIIVYLMKIIKFNKELLLAKINDILDWFVIFPVCIMIVTICFTFFFTFTIVDGKSMEPTLTSGEEMFLNYNSEKNRFDIVVVRVSSEYETVNDDALYVKRIIGMPGDYIEYKTYMVGLNQRCDLYINGEKVEEAFYGENDQYGITNHFYFESICAKNGLAITKNSNGKVVIPDGYYLVLGDNRMVSKDSRDLGLIKEKDIIGTIKYKVNSLFSYEKIN